MTKLKLCYITYYTLSRGGKIMREGEVILLVLTGMDLSFQTEMD
jgi:hypothetical protein